MDGIFAIRVSTVIFLICGLMMLLSLPLIVGVGSNILLASKFLFFVGLIFRVARR